MFIYFKFQERLYLHSCFYARITVYFPTGNVFQVVRLKTQFFINFGECYRVNGLSVIDGVYRSGFTSAHTSIRDVNRGHLRFMNKITRNLCDRCLL